VKQSLEMRLFLSLNICIGNTGNEKPENKTEETIEQKPEQKISGRVSSSFFKLLIKLAS